MPTDPARYAIVRYDNDPPYLVIDPPGNLPDLAREYFEREEVYEKYEGFAHYLRTLGYTAVRPDFLQYS
jgi:hypothetical protein